MQQMWWLNRGQRKNSGSPHTPAASTAQRRQQGLRSMRSADPRDWNFLEALWFTYSSLPHNLEILFYIQTKEPIWA